MIMTDRTNHGVLACLVSINQFQNSKIIERNLFPTELWGCVFEFIFSPENQKALINFIVNNLLIRSISQDFLDAKLPPVEYLEKISLFAERWESRKLIEINVDDYLAEAEQNTLSCL